MKRGRKIKERADNRELLLGSKENVAYPDEEDEKHKERNAKKFQEHLPGEFLPQQGVLEKEICEDRVYEDDRRELDAYGEAEEDRG